jgi:hypothetical protein
MLREKGELTTNMKLENAEIPHGARERKTVTMHIDTTRVVSPCGAREAGTASWLREPMTGSRKKAHVAAASSPLKSPGLNEAKPMSDYMDEKFREDHKSMYVMKANL